MATLTLIKKVKQRLTEEVIAVALRANHGLLHPAADSLGVSRRTLQRRLGKSAALRAVQAEVVEETLDVAECSLIRALTAGEAWAICFYLKCKGKGRGYSERAEITGANGGPIEVSVSEAELDKILAGR